MANNNETVASVADCIRHLADTLPNCVILNIAQCNFIADRIESALRREKRPRRNCDRFKNEDEADFHYRKEHKTTYAPAGDFIRWLFAPVAEGGES